MSEYSTLRQFKFKQAIIKAYYYESQYYVIDCQNTLYILNNDYKLQLKMKLIKDDNDLHHYSNNYSFSNGIISIAKAHSVLCVKYHDKKVKVVYKKEHNSNDIVCTELNKNGTMLLTCSVDGKASILNTVSQSYYYTFNNQPDYCSSAFFSSKNIFVYIGYFNLENKILNLKNLKLMEFELKNPVESGAFFDDDTKLFLADRAGNSIIYDCIDEEIISTKILFEEWVSCTTLINEKYILVGTRKDKIHILDLFENEIISTIDLDSHGVTSINVENEKLIIAFADSTFEIISLNHLQENFMTHLHLHEYKEAKDILDQNLFLYTDKSIEKFESGFTTVHAKAKDLVSQSKVFDALNIVKPFMDYQKFKNPLELLFIQQDNIANFVEAVNKNNIKVAYSLAEKYQVILTLDSYQTLERGWEKAFGQAKKVIESDNLHGKNKAKIILDAYSRINQKSELVKQLLSNSDKFVLADQYVKQQKFEQYFALINRFTFLQNTILHKKIDTLASTLKSKALEMSSDDNIEEAKKLYARLLTFPEYSAFAKKKLNYIDTQIELKGLIESNNTKVVYKHIEKYPYLAYEDMFLKYNLYFEKDLKNAQHQIEKDNMQFAIKTLSKYFSIPYLNDKIANLFKHTYLRELENNNFKEYDVIKTILSYQKLFGIDDQIKDIFKDKHMEDEFKYALKSTDKIDIDKYPETILAA